jgi:hypothetical protein
MVNVASCGAGALATARAATLKQLGPLAYSVAAALELLRWRGCTVQVCCVWWVQAHGVRAGMQQIFLSMLGKDRHHPLMWNPNNRES